jgi:hypothetical protein
MGLLPEEVRGDAIYRAGVVGCACRTWQCQTRTRRYISGQGDKFSKVLVKYRALPLLRRITELL